MNKTACILILFLALSLLLGAVGCAQSPPQEELIEVNDEKGTQGEIEEVTLHANNCKGDEPMNMVLPAEKGYTHELFIDARPGAKINLGRTRNEIYDYYKIEKPMDQAKSVCSIPVSAPAHTYYVYELEWTETWREGGVEVGQPDGSAEATYRIKETILCEVVGVSFEPCPSTE